jgi:Flp pilus assembly protein TadD
LEKAATPPPRSLAARDFIVGTLATTKPTPARLELAVKLGRESVRLAPGRPWAHNALALALEATGDADGAIAAWREAVRIEPGYFDGWRNLSRVLVDRGDVEASIPALRKVASIAPGQKRSWDRLGIALSKHGDYDEAAAAFEKALKIAPDDPSLLCNLGTALLRSGRFAEAREFMRKGHEIGSKTKGWSYPSAKWVAECELRVAVEARREQILKGATPTLEERIRIARLVCRPKRLWVEAFEHYTEAFSEDTSLPSQADPDYLLEAAAAGIHGSAGRGVGSPEDPERRAALRRRVLDLLAAALSEMEDIVGDAAPTAAAVAANRAAFWLTDPELAHVGPRSDFGGIPAEEATSWRGLWARCEAIAPASRPASRPLLTR